MNPSPHPFSKNESTLFIGLILFFFALFLLNLVSFIQEVKLSTGAIFDIAEITDRRVHTVESRRGKWTDYEVKYKFDVNGESYTYSDSTGRDDLWAALQSAEWEDSKNTGTLSVLYNPKKPWINRPLHPDDWPYGGPIAGMILMGGLSALLFGVLKKQVHSRPDASFK